LLNSYGFYVIQAPDLDAAQQIARRNPILQQGRRSSAEVDQIFGFRRAWGD